MFGGKTCLMVKQSKRKSSIQRFDFPEWITLVKKSKYIDQMTAVNTTLLMNTMVSAFSTKLFNLYPLNEMLCSE